MKADKLKIANYKSLGSERNELSVGSGITVIIGKNESGKTNITEAAGELDFSRSPYYIEESEKKLNRFSGGGDIQITLTTTRKDKPGESIITAHKDGIIVSGAIMDAIYADSEIRAYIARLEKISGKNAENTSFCRHLAFIEKWQNINMDEKRQELSVYFFDSFCKNPYLLLTQLRAAAEEAEPRTGSLLYDLYKKTAEYAWELPYILVTSNGGRNSLSEYYFLDEVANLKSDDIFFKLLFAAGINVSDGADAFDLSKPLAREMLKAGLSSLAERFSDFSGKDFTLSYEIRNGRFYLTTVLQGKRAMLDELSVCEKWHFLLYIDILWHDIKNRNILFVFDQPGLYMHVNAQKELLKIFKSITKGGHQIIYTTHSPFLLDINDMASMRAVEKEDGQTHIYNKIYSEELSTGSKMETLTPIFEALGFSFPQRYGIENRLNLIVEGISDYYYIKAMLVYLCGKEDNTPYVLPSVGASNISNVASILIGWGLPFKAIVDYDEEGRKAAEKMRQKLGLQPGEDIFYINGKKTYRADSPCRIEDMLDKLDRAKIQTARGKRTKALVSREFYDLIIAGNLIPSEVTVANFKTLFKALGVDT